MASISKRGNSYLISVSCGYDINNRQIRRTTTWTPESTLTQKQLEKELQRQTVLFEERVKHTSLCDGNIRLIDFIDIFMQDYAKTNLKDKTIYIYNDKIKDISQALGHIKLKDLRPGHIASFYSNLQEAGMRRKKWAICKIDFKKWLSNNKLSLESLSKESGASAWAFKQLRDGNHISIESAEKIATYMGKCTSEIFLIEKNMKPLSPSTIRGYHRVLSSILFRAVKLGYIQENPASRAELPSIKTRAAYLDEDDARQLLILLRSEPIKQRILITFDLLSGLRRGELLGLRWQDIDFERQTITICQTSNYVPGKGVYVDTPKTADSFRPIRLSRSAFVLLLEYKDWQLGRQQLMGDAWEDKDGRVFTTDTGAPIFPDSITQWFSKFIKRVGLPKVSVHSLRHTYASLMIADGVPLVVVSHQLGHSQTSTTVDIYAHIIKSAEAMAAQTFDKFNDIIVTDPSKEGVLRAASE